MHLLLSHRWFYTCKACGFFQWADGRKSLAPPSSASPATQPHQWQGSSGSGAGPSSHGVGGSNYGQRSDQNTATASPLGGSPRMGSSPSQFPGGATSPLQQRDGFLRSMGFTGAENPSMSGGGGRGAPGTPPAASPQASPGFGATAARFQTAGNQGGYGTGPRTGGAGSGAAMRPGLCRGVPVKIQVRLAVILLLIKMTLAA